MPIVLKNGPARAFDQEEYQAASYAIMGHVFHVHNDFGRLLTEQLFKQEIASRCSAHGIPAEREVRIFVTHETFEKEYSMDLLFSGGVMFEAKAVEALAPAHFAQALNYLLLAGRHHGTLINLRTECVQFELVSTTLTPESRRQFTVDERGWRSVNEPSQRLREKMVQLLRDWGAFLVIDLYQEAITHFLGGPDKVVQSVDVYSDERRLGHQNVHLLTDDTAFAFTALTESTERMRIHLSKLLSHTRLAHLQWINLNQHRIELVTLSR